MAEKPEKAASRSAHGPAAAPHHTPRTAADKAARDARLAAEMRKNLLKRKRQRRDRARPAD
jgi:hypothetical protein